MMSDGAENVPMFAPDTGEVVHVPRDYDDTQSAVVKKALMLIHGLCITCVVLVCWYAVQKFGLDWSYKSKGTFGWHAVFMTLGFVVCYVQSALIYRTLTNFPHKSRKVIHMTLHALALAFVVGGLLAIFKFHKDLNIPHLFSLHSWMGIITVALFIVQYIAAFAVFWKPRFSDTVRAAFLPVHTRTGIIVLLACVTSTVCMGVMERLTFDKDCKQDGTQLSNGICKVANAYALVVALATVLTSVVLLTNKN
mmetsp:Transcript_10245/g.19228  ORF Transcript_10245/g.19228 Transcript_10245/m.19228 type:complete len:251 (-) Transcript_10245:7-759(-)